MIMNRIGQALKRQDWTLVTIEFVLVVAGVLLAFLIGDWAAGRSERAVRRESVDRLLHESEQDVGNLREMLKTQRTDVLAPMRVVAANLRNPSPAPSIAAEMISGITRSSVLPKPLAPDSVYRELIASGRFGELGDVRMRDAVSNYASQMAYLDQAIDYARMGLPRTWSGDAVHFAYDASHDRRRNDVDFRKFAADRSVEDQFLTRLASQEFLVRNYTGALEAAEAMCREVARVAGRPCRPNAQSSVG
jgi:hypothetical protein